MKSMIEIVYKENKEQANGNEGYFHLPKNIRQVGDTNGRERIYLEDYVGTFLKTINEQIQNIAQKKDTLCRRMYN